MTSLRHNEPLDPQSAYLDAARACILDVGWRRTTLTEVARLSGNPLPQEVEPLVVALLLGVVTDYAVFFLSEFRDQLRSGAGSGDGVRAAALAVIPIVFTGGVILSLSLLALRASSLGFFRELAPALAVTVAVAMLVSLVFVPALIALLGRFSVWPVRPVKDEDDPATRRPLGQPHLLQGGLDPLDHVAEPYPLLLAVVHGQQRAVHDRHVLRPEL